MYSAVIYYVFLYQYIKVLGNIKTVVNQYSLLSLLIIRLWTLFFKNIGKYKAIKDLNIAKILIFIYLNLFENKFIIIFISLKKLFLEIIGYFYYFNKKVVW